MKQETVFERTLNLPIWISHTLFPLNLKSDHEHFFSLILSFAKENHSIRSFDIDNADAQYREKKHEEFLLFFELLF